MTLPASKDEPLNVAASFPALFVDLFSHTICHRPAGYNFVESRALTGTSAWLGFLLGWAIWRLFFQLRLDVRPQVYALVPGPPVCPGRAQQDGGCPRVITAANPLGPLVRFVLATPSPPAVFIGPAPQILPAMFCFASPECMDRQGRHLRRSAVAAPLRPHSLRHITIHEREQWMEQQQGSGGIEEEGLHLCKIRLCFVEIRDVCGNLSFDRHRPRYDIGLLFLTLDNKQDRDSAPYYRFWTLILTRLKGVSSYTPGQGSGIWNHATYVLGARHSASQDSGWCVVFMVYHIPSSSATTLSIFF
ncbi:uncharacterized protein PADG_06045 [Paracoccidioides brasiliensis Pb18]|uniref:Uncharacterized protein n=1 Tax=Paracoccidioides brasiliensis (strain Pb18) TaxID=502780 RepID=C1GFK9_PARBD|nr:uncharacterized protein PADG_06045 [Paracoccidioides brasiliensis Pb18]EEH49966.2 hypothetical protein PADG_06045 [Paracoccidioides brasiliensis Pb18]